MSIAKSIKLYLVENNIKQAWLAKKMGIATDKLCLALNDKRKMDTEEFSKIITALNVPAELFIKSEHDSA